MYLSEFKESYCHGSRWGTIAQALIFGVLVHSSFAQEVDHFDWGAITSPQIAGTPFTVGLTAQDATNGMVSGFNGCVALSAGIPTTVGSDSATQFYPMGSFYGRERTQVIYQPGEIGCAGRITSLALNVATVPVPTLNQWTIRIKHTSLMAYTNYIWEGTGWTTVYQANVSVTATG
jgi:hypothetical protein